jgi:uncharacterized membrane protein
VDIYPWLKTAHILLAIVAVGANLTYGVWQVRAAREPQHLGWTLRGVKFLDDRIANPAYIGLAVLGVLMVLIGPWRFEMPWIAVSIGLYVLLAVVGIALYTPTLSRQISVYETDGPQSAEFTALARRGRVVGISMGVIVMVIVGLMVLKPGA